MALTVKAIYENKGRNGTEIRRFSVDQGASTNFEYLTEKVKQVFGGGMADKRYSFYWKDPEEDYIILSSDEELTEALGFVNDGIFRLYIQENEPVEEKGCRGQLHPGVVCDGCEGPIRGLRLKCTICPDYDLCRRCDRKGLHPEHPMMGIRVPRGHGFMMGPMPGSFPGMRMGMPHHIGPAMGGPGPHHGPPPMGAPGTHGPPMGMGGPHGPAFGPHGPPPPHFRRMMRRMWKKWADGDSSDEKEGETPQCPWKRRCGKGKQEKAQGEEANVAEGETVQHENHNPDQADVPMEDEGEACSNKEGKTEEGQDCPCPHGPEGRCGRGRGRGRGMGRGPGGRGRHCPRRMMMMHMMGPHCPCPMPDNVEKPADDAGNPDKKEGKCPLPCAGPVAPSCGIAVGGCMPHAMPGHPHGPHGRCGMPDGPGPMGPMLPPPPAGAARPVWRRWMKQYWRAMNGSTSDSSDKENEGKNTAEENKGEEKVGGSGKSREEKTGGTTTDGAQMDTDLTEEVCEKIASELENIGDEMATMLDPLNLDTDSNDEAEKEGVQGEDAGGPAMWGPYGPWMMWGRHGHGSGQGLHGRGHGHGHGHRHHHGHGRHAENAPRTPKVTIVNTKSTANNKPDHTDVPKPQEDPQIRTFAPVTEPRRVVQMTPLTPAANTPTTEPQRVVQVTPLTPAASTPTTEPQRVVQMTPLTPAASITATQGTDWTIVVSSANEEAKEATGDQAKPEGAEPKIAQALAHLQAMGFSDDGGWLTRLLEEKNGDLNQVLDSIRPKPQ